MRLGGEQAEDPLSLIAPLWLITLGISLKCLQSQGFTLEIARTDQAKGLIVFNWPLVTSS